MTRVTRIVRHPSLAFPHQRERTRRHRRAGRRARAYVRQAGRFAWHVACALGRWLRRCWHVASVLTLFFWHGIGAGFAELRRAGE